jgi:hypothetical protein
MHLKPGTFRVNAAIAIHRHCSDFATLHLRICIKHLIRSTDILDCIYAILFLVT